jgi:hypothetical protein
MSALGQTNEKNKWYLMLGEIHNPVIHGKSIDSDPHIETHYLVYDRFNTENGVSYSYLENYDEYDTDNEYDTDDGYDSHNRIIYLDELTNFLKQSYVNFSILNPNYLKKHPTIRNYHNIIKKPNYIKPEIGEYIILPTQESIAILKTFWLRIIQRKWQKIFKERQTVLSLRKCPGSLYTKEITGKWPQMCRYLPCLKGMLSDIK